AGSGDELGNVGLVAAAERALEARVALELVPPAPALLDRGLACDRIDDLMHALVAQPQRVGDLAHRTAGGVQRADRMLIGDLRAIGFELQLDELVADRSSFAQKLLV